MYKKIILIASTLTLFSCTITPTNSVKPKKTPAYSGDLLQFNETRDAQESTPRMIITDNWLRIDEGKDTDDFVLYDRREKLIYNIVMEEKSILIMDTTASDVKADFPLNWKVKSEKSNMLMRTDDTTAARSVHYNFSLNGKSCYDTVALDKGMDAPLTAIKEYRQALANQLKKYYKPAKGENCAEAIKILSPNIHLKQGFPVREWSNYGYQRFLVDYRQKIIFPERLFQLPEGFSKSKL